MKEAKVVNSEEFEEDVEEEAELEEESKETKSKVKVENLELDFSMDSIVRLQKEIDFTDSEYQKIVGNFLIEQFKKDEKLKTCYSTRLVTLQAVWNSILVVAKKKATSGAAVMSDEEVFGLAIHYVQDGEIKETKEEKYTLTKAEKISLEEKARKEYLAEQKFKLEEEKRKCQEREAKKFEQERKRREESGQLSLFE